MIPKLKHYKNIVGNNVIENIKKESENLKDKHIVHVNATSNGGGVAEILSTLTFLMNDLGMKTGWRVILGNNDFFKITKKIHNSLQGGKESLTNIEKKTYLDYCKKNSTINHLNKHDIVVIHDPQPLPMILDYNTRSNWIWRCHIDLSKPNKDTYNFLLPYVKKYDGAIISSKKYKMNNLKKPQFIIPPSIDPLSNKNIELSETKRKRILSQNGIDLSKPIISQISRFDPWKDPFGVLKMYEKIKQKKDCQLILMGDMASDDPQGPIIYEKILEKAKTINDIHLITKRDDLLVNAIQKESAVVFQNSKKEGFGLTVSEALWKKTPVISRDVGGISSQLINSKSGYLIKSDIQGIKNTLKLLNNEKLRNKMGEYGHNFIKNNFLITRHLTDYIKLFNKFYPKPDFRKYI
jgi:trehalose synthase